MKPSDHGDVRRRVDAADLVDRDDIGMVQRRRRPRFAFETNQPIRVRRHGDREYFQREIPKQLRIAGAVDFAHASGPNGIEDFVVGDVSSGAEGQRQASITGESLGDETVAVLISYGVRANRKARC